MQTKALDKRWEMNFRKNTFVSYENTCFRKRRLRFCETAFPKLSKLGIVRRELVGINKCEQFRVKREEGAEKKKGAETLSVAEREVKRERKREREYLE